MTRHAMSQISTASFVNECQCANNCHSDETCHVTILNNKESPNDSCCPTSTGMGWCVSPTCHSDSPCHVTGILHVTVILHVRERELKALFVWANVVVCDEALLLQSCPGHALWVRAFSKLSSCHPILLEKRSHCPRARVEELANGSFNVIRRIRLAPDQWHPKSSWHPKTSWHWLF